MNPVDFSTTPNRTELLAAAEEELARCLRLLVGCLSSVELFDDLPKVRVLDYYPVLPEQPFQVERSHELTLYTRGDLDRPPSLRKPPLRVLQPKAASNHLVRRWALRHVPSGNRSRRRHKPDKMPSMDSDRPTLSFRSTQPRRILLTWLHGKTADP